MGGMHPPRKKAMSGGGWATPPDPATGFLGPEMSVVYVGAHGGVAGGSAVANVTISSLFLGDHIGAPRVTIIDTRLEQEGTITRGEGGGRKS